MSDDSSSNSHVRQAGDGSFKIKVASTGEIYTVPPDIPIIDVLSENGIDVPTSCEQGICGTCLTGVIEGEPEHNDAFLTDEEHAANDQMTLCCSRSKSEMLVLDL